MSSDEVIKRFILKKPRRLFSPLHAKYGKVSPVTLCGIVEMENTIFCLISIIGNSNLYYRA